MRIRLLTIGIAALVCSCGGGGNSGDPGSSGAAGLAPQWPIDGAWGASSDGMGSTLTMNLNSQGPLVTGVGTYSVGAIRTGSVGIAGTYHPPAAILAITYDHGETVTLSAEVTDNNMRGKLTYKSGTVIDIGFVRP